jgi:sulfite exporter TauE/SafE
MIWQIITSGFMLGLFSSAHCVGMCGPLALALPVKHLPTAERRLSMALFYGGRIVMYIVVGTLFALLGRTFYLAGLQQWLSIISGVMVLVFSAQYFLKKTNRLPAFMQKFHNGLNLFMAKQFKKPTLKSFLMLGFANGLLPCGMVYIAVALALTTKTIFNGALLMGMFGIGTLPALILLGYAGSFVSLPVRNYIRKITPVFMLLIGLLLILRGMNLGIPYISPIMADAPRDGILCH